MIRVPLPLYIRPDINRDTAPTVKMSAAVVKPATTAGFSHLDEFNPEEAIHHHAPLTPATWLKELWSGFKNDLLSLLKGPPDLSKETSH